MKILAPNDWEIKKLIYLVLTTLLAIIDLFWFESLGINVSYLQNLVGFVFLTFIPGFLILRICKIHIGLVESLLYSIAISIAFIYAVGLFANFVLPQLGITRPISTIPIISVMSIFTLILTVIAYIRDKEFISQPVQFNIKELLSPFYLLAMLLPVLTILGTQMVNAYQNNIVLLIMLGTIASIVGMVSFNLIPEKTYPILLITIAISLKLFLSLSSLHLFGHDIHIQYYFQHIVLQNGFWDWSIPDNYNSCLSLVMLSPIYSLVAGIKEVWIFKIVFPILSSILPLALYGIYRYQVEAKIAFLATFLFMSIPGGILSLDSSPGREVSAKLYIALLILLMVEKKLSNIQKCVLAIIFIISLVFTHYSSAYMLIALFSIGWIILQLAKQPKINNLWKRFLKFDLFECSNSSESLSYSILNIAIISLLLIIGLTWYMSVSSASAFNAIVNMGNKVFEGLTGFLDTTTREQVALSGLGIGFLKVDILSKIFRILQYITEIYIVVGFFAMLLKSNQLRFQKHFIALSVSAALFLFNSIFLPGFSANLGMRRIYGFTLIFLAPFCIYGAKIIWHGIVWLFNYALKINTNWQSVYSINNSYLPVMTLTVLIPYFLFISGFVPAVSKAYCEVQELNSSAIALGPYRTDRNAFNQMEISAADRLWDIIPANARVSADLYSSTLLWEQQLKRVTTISQSGYIPKDSYIFLRSWNIKNDELLVRLGYAFGTHVNLTKRPTLFDRLKQSDEIYDNGGARILAPADTE